MPNTVLPEPFDQVPVIDEPTDLQRELALRRFPPAVVPGVGPIADPNHQHVDVVDVPVPKWVLASVAWQLEQRDGGTADRSLVERLLMEYAYARERFRTQDGRDAVNVLLAADAGDRQVITRGR